MWIYVPNQNEKVQEETHDRFKFRGCENNIETLRYFKMTLPLFEVLQKSLPIPLSHAIETITNASVG